MFRTLPTIMRHLFAFPRALLFGFSRLCQSLSRHLPRRRPRTFARAIHPNFISCISPLRAARAFALALALSAGLVPATEAHAQLTAQLPTPVAASELESMLRAAGADDALLAIALPLHDEYFARFRAFEAQEVDDSLRRTISPLDVAPSVDDAKRAADTRRRIFARAAQIDAALVDEIVSLLTPEDSAKAERVRGALARRRAIAAIPAFGFNRGAHAFDLRSAPTLTSLDAATRAAIAPVFATYDAELTQQLERLAEASFVRRVRAAEAREELGVSASPPPPTDGDAAANGDAMNSDWLRSIQEVQRRAGEDMTRIDAAIRKLHRETLAAIEPRVSPIVASALRAHLVREVYPALGLSGDFDAARKTAESLRASGTLDDARWASVESIIQAHEAELRPDLDKLLALSDASAGRGDDFMLAGMRTADDTRDRDDIRARANDVITRNAQSLRTALGLDTRAQRDGGSDRPANIAVGGATVTGGVQIAVMGGDGETLALSAEDLVDSGISLGGMFGGTGGGGGIARPMSRDELDLLATKLGFTNETRAIFDAIIAQCAEERIAAERADRAAADAAQPQLPEGTMAMTLTIGADGGVTVGEAGPADPEKLAQIIDGAEERMFDGLKAAADPSKADAVEAARRARARTRLLMGERGAQAADIAAIVESASLDTAARALIADDVREWDESSLPAIRGMRNEVVRAMREREELIEASAQIEEIDEGDGNIRMGRAMRIEGETVENLQKLDAQIRDARAKLVERNRDTINTLVAKLESSPTAVRAIRRGFARVVETAAYRIPRDLEPFFARAFALDGLRPATRDAIEAIRAEWVESRESLCEAFATAREQERAETKDDTARGFASFGASVQARKRLTADLEQLENLTVRRIRDLLTIEFGAEKAATVGELKPRRAQNTPVLEIGGESSAP
jgi:hypothetical protein